MIYLRNSTLHLKSGGDCAINLFRSRLSGILTGNLSGYGCLTFTIVYSSLFIQYKILQIGSMGKYCTDFSTEKYNYQNNVLFSVQIVIGEPMHSEGYLDCGNG
ncbi:hypothetical protein GCM10023189_31570 [Nibrella saemangeumensis]|uniref:Uncharacterized protein n=1 Tax=Nibrella saemangeumensis TaxID=1084526 RepID=A0ABP8MZJ7_9BACT